MTMCEFVVSLLNKSLPFLHLCLTLLFLFLPSFLVLLPSSNSFSSFSSFFLSLNSFFLFVGLSSILSLLPPICVFVFLCLSHSVSPISTGLHSCSKEQRQRAEELYGPTTRSVELVHNDTLIRVYFRRRKQVPTL